MEEFYPIIGEDASEYFIMRIKLQCNVTIIRILVKFLIVVRKMATVVLIRDITFCLLPELTVSGSHTR